MNYACVLIELFQFSHTLHLIELSTLWIKYFFSEIENQKHYPPPTQPHTHTHMRLILLQSAKTIRIRKSLMKNEHFLFNSTFCSFPRKHFFLFVFTARFLLFCFSHFVVFLLCKPKLFPLSNLASSVFFFVSFCSFL